MNSIHKNIDNQNAFIKQSGISEQSLTAVRSFAKDGELFIMYDV
jgi:hypothetical protein